MTQTGFVAEVGAVVNGQFELLEYVGKGATARVWRARHLLGRFDVALKLLNATRHDFELGREEFHQLCNLYHPNVVRTFGMQLVEGHDQAFVTMEFVDGRTLDAMAHGKRREAPELVLQWLIQMVDVLQYLHSMRIIHKDIKPANIVLDEQRLEPRAVLIDFNISHLQSPDFGTPAYRCPGVEADRVWSPHSDVWALALTFYEVLVCREIFDRKTAFDVDLSGDECPPGFPAGVFGAIQGIIQGRGTDGEFAEGYRKLFDVESLDRAEIELSEEVAREFGVGSRNQRFLTLAMLNFDPEQPRSKDVILRHALHQSGRPASANEMRKLRPVFSQLKASGVLEYKGKGNKKAMLTEGFRKAVGQGLGG